MNDKEDFLARWSRRKREAERPEEAPPPAAPASSAPQAEAADAADLAPGPNQQDAEARDPAALPALDSVGAETDIRAFLARGVPAALTREALRLAWSADPAIRDFVGLSENSWDFNAVGGVPGFGPMLPPVSAGVPSEIVREIAESEPPSPARSAVAEAGESPPEPAAPDSPAGIIAHRNLNGDGEAPPQPAETVESKDGRMADKQPQDVAPQNTKKDGDLAAIVPARRHGGALPS